MTEETQGRKHLIPFARDVGQAAVVFVILVLLWNIILGTRFSYLTLVPALILTVSLYWVGFPGWNGFHATYFSLVLGALAVAWSLAIWVFIAEFAGVIPLGLDRPIQSAGLQRNTINGMVKLTPTNYSVGDEGSVVAELSNQGPNTARCRVVTLYLPRGFLDGYVIMAPTSPEYSKIEFEKWGANSTHIDFKGIELGSGEKREFRVNVAAAEPGKYSGNLRLACVAKIGSGTFERVYSKTDVALVVVP